MKREVKGPNVVSPANIRATLDGRKTVRRVRGNPPKYFHFITNLSVIHPETRAEASRRLRNPPELLRVLERAGQILRKNIFCRSLPLE